jgi:hypothetical protein
LGRKFVTELCSYGQNLILQKWIAVLHM